MPAASSVGYIFLAASQAQLLGPSHADEVALACSLRGSAISEYVLSDSCSWVTAYSCRASRSLFDESSNGLWLRHVHGMAALNLDNS